ncbi:competence protein ComFC [Melghirimyces profundicolus]|uniref:Competence protein ComFC n=1 Tax=Melghirimyces profundicolus TaxID=1242148 RepID=A0A2T6C2U6_9BACL|nr:ComF family protein [Melghirimyces profundicolus]PTX62567.1 competence protein ComFC [Melghirimyces profundicolus]
MTGWWERWFAGPGRCCLCGGPHRVTPWAGVWDRICMSCRGRLHRIHLPVCPRCGRGGTRGTTCEDCIHHPPGVLERNVAVLRYNAYAKELIRLFKYRGRECLALPLAEMMAERVFECGIRANALVSVPLHEDKLRRRGFNQSELLAREMGRLLRLPLIPVLVKVSPTLPQSRKSRRERLKALRGAFRVKPERIPGADQGTWLLTDDVYTTGTTLLECARALKAAGADRVCSVTLAR